MTEAMNQTIGIAVPAPLTIKIDQTVAEAAKVLEIAGYVRDRLFGGRSDQNAKTALSEVTQSTVDNSVNELASIIGRLSNVVSDINSRL